MPELVCAADSPDWLTERRRGITATDITAITGLSPYESAYSLFFKKRGDIPDEHADNDRLRLGRELEPIIVARFWDQHPELEPIIVARFWDQHPELESDGQGSCLYRNTARPWQLATPDRALVRRAFQDGEQIGRYLDRCAVLEVKSWADYDRDRWADGPPARVRAQVLWQMDTLDVAVGHVGVLFLPSGEFRSYVIEHHPSHTKYMAEMAYGADIMCEVCQDTTLLREAGRDFMDRLDLNDPPSPDASSATLAALKARFTDVHHDKTAEIDAEVWEHFYWITEEIAACEAVKRQCEAEIREQAGEARTLTVNGTKVATRIVGDYPVKAHTRHSDYIRRVASKGDTDV